MSMSMLEPRWTTFDSSVRSKTSTSSIFISDAIMQIEENGQLRDASLNTAAALPSPPPPINYHPLAHFRKHESGKWYNWLHKMPWWYMWGWTKTTLTFFLGPFEAFPTGINCINLWGQLDKKITPFSTSFWIFLSVCDPSFYKFWLWCLSIGYRKEWRRSIYHFTTLFL